MIFSSRRSRLDALAPTRLALAGAIAACHGGDGAVSYHLEGADATRSLEHEGALPR